jgi:hypothetical protein
MMLPSRVVCDVAVPATLSTEAFGFDAPVVVPLDDPQRLIGDEHADELARTPLPDKRDCPRRLPARPFE